MRQEAGIIVMTTHKELNTRPETTGNFKTYSYVVIYSYSLTSFNFEMHC